MQFHFHRDTKHVSYLTFIFELVLSNLIIEVAIDIIAYI